MRLDVTARCIGLHMRFHNDSSPGELIEWIDGDIEQIANFSSQRIIQVVGNLLLLTDILVALFADGWRIGSPFLLFPDVMLLALNAVHSIAVRHDRAVKQGKLRSLRLSQGAVQWHRGDSFLRGKRVHPARVVRATGPYLCG